MRQLLVERDRMIANTECPRQSATGSRQCLEPELRQHPGAAEIPRIGNDKAPSLMQLAESISESRCALRHHALLLTGSPADNRLRKTRMCPASASCTRNVGSHT